MKINRKDKPSNDVKQQSKAIKNEETRSPKTTAVPIKKPPIQVKKTQLGANQETLNELFAASQQPARKGFPIKAPIRKPPKMEKLKKFAPKRSSLKPSASLMEKVARMDKDAIKPRTDTKSPIKCPYCHEDLINNENNMNKDMQLRTILPPVIQMELDRIMAAEENHRKEREDQQYMGDLSKQRFVSNMDQFRFCQLHRLELDVKPKGIRLGYPIDLDFTELGTRVVSLKPELMKLINGEIDSPFRTMALTAYKDMGSHKARNTMTVMARFEKTLPGYYGSKGASIIMDKIIDMLLHTGVITKDKTHPQLPLEYIQQVLVPETGWRLIQQDLIKKGPGTDYTVENARQVMKNSVNFGSKMYPADDEEALCPVELNDDKDKDNDMNTSEDDQDQNTEEILEYVSSGDEQD